MRVQIPAYTNKWMQGDRYGEVVKVVRLPQPGARQIAHVKLDISGKTVRVLLNDCREVGR